MFGIVLVLEWVVLANTAETCWMLSRLSTSDFPALRNYFSQEYTPAALLVCKSLALDNPVCFRKRVPLNSFVETIPFTVTLTPFWTDWAECGLDESCLGYCEQSVAYDSSSRGSMLCVTYLAERRVIAITHWLGLKVRLTALTQSMSFFPSTKVFPMEPSLTGWRCALCKIVDDMVIPPNGAILRKGCHSMNLDTASQCITFFCT